MVNELTVQQQQALALSKARQRRAAQSTPEPMNEGIRTAGRFGRNLAGGLSSAADIALLAPKTAALGISALTGSETLKNIGQTPSMRDSVLGMIDKATNNKLQPRGFGEKAVDTVSEMMVPTGFAAKPTSGAPGLMSAVRATLDIPGTVTSAFKGPMANIAPAQVERLSSEELRKLSGQTYKRAAQSGGILKPEATNRWVDEIDQISPQTQMGQMLQGETPVSKALSVIKKFRDQPIDLDSAHEIDKILGDKITYDAGKMTTEGRQFFDIQNKFRDMIENASLEDVVGGKNGFEAIKEARKLWSRSLKLRDVERVITRAELMDNPATGIKTGFRTLLTNPNRIKGFTAQEQKAIRQAAETGRVQDILRTFGSRLGTVITTSTLGPGAAAAASYAGPAVSRSMAEKIAMGKANKVADMVAGVPPRVPQGTGKGAQAAANILSNLLGRAQ